MKRKLKTIDLFAGAGGLSLGFVLSSAAEYDPVFAVEHDAAAALTYQTNFGTEVSQATLNSSWLRTTPRRM